MIWRAVVYCRCSTEEEAQKDALAKQVQEAEECILQKEWMQVDSYVESKSGTTTKGRAEYNRLFDDLLEDKFDIVVVKSQDRLMRNAKDWYLFLDRLVASGKRLYLYIENKFYTPDDALITGIKAILAEEYSSELSKKINNAHKNRQKKGKVFIFPPNTYGLCKISKGRYELVEDEAEAIRLIFQLAKNYGCGTIADILEENEIYDREGKPFEEEAIRRIIRNPIRCGTIVQNKRHWDFQTKRMVQVPKEKWVVHKNAVPACVTEKEWQEANRAMDERAMAGNVKNCKSESSHRGKYILSGKLKCGQCGAVFYRRYRKKYKDDSYIVEWKCSSYLYHGRRAEGCNNIVLNEEKLFDLLQNFQRDSYREGQRDPMDIVEKVMAFIEKVLEKNQDFQKKKRLEEKLCFQKTLSDRLLDKLLYGVITDDIYKIKMEELEESIKKTEEELERLPDEAEVKKMLENRMYVIRQKLESSFVKKAVVSEMLDSIEAIFVFPDHLEIHFYLEKSRKTAVCCVLPDDFVYQKKKAMECIRIEKYMRENPCITAKEIAGLEGVGLSAVNYRIRKLRRQGKICFDGKGGHGKWIVCDDKEGE